MMPTQTIRRVTRRFRQDETGQASVEFLLTIIFMTLLLFALIELLLFIHTYSALADAAKEGVRYAVVHGSTSSFPSGPGSTTDIDGPPAPSTAVPGNGSGYGVVKTYAMYSFHNPAAVTVTVTYDPAGEGTGCTTNTNNAPAVNGYPCSVRVTVSYPYQPFFGFGWPTVTVNAAAEGRIFF